MNNLKITTTVSGGLGELAELSCSANQNWPALEVRCRARPSGEINNWSQFTQ